MLDPRVYVYSVHTSRAAPISPEPIEPRQAFSSNQASTLQRENYHGGLRFHISIHFVLDCARVQFRVGTRIFGHLL